jgi:hypothetical protein
MKRDHMTDDRLMWLEERLLKVERFLATLVPAAPDEDGGIPDPDMENVTCSTCDRRESGNCGVCIHNWEGPI